MSYISWDSIDSGSSFRLGEFGVSTYRIPGVDPLLVSVLDNIQRLLLVQDPVLPVLATKAHGAKNDLGNLQARLPQAVLSRLSAYTQDRMYVPGCGAIPRIFHLLARHYDVKSSSKIGSVDIYSNEKKIS